MEIIKKVFHQRCNETGSLSFLEGERDIPFPIKRVYYICGVAPDARRGFHAHKALEQYLICLHGSCEVLLDDAAEKVCVTLDDPNEGLYVGSGVWHEIYHFSAGAVLLVLASEYYAESDYLRDYDAFKAYVKSASSCDKAVT